MKIIKVDLLNKSNPDESNLATINVDTIACIYERDGYSALTLIGMADGELRCKESYSDILHLIETCDSI